MNQKGSVTDIMAVTATFFILAVLSVVGLLIFNTAIDTGIFDSGVMGAVQNSFLMIGVGAIIFIIGAIVVAAALAYQVGSTPALIVVGIILLPVIVIFIAGLSMGWTAIATDPGTAAAAASIPFMNLIMNNLVLIAVLASILMIVAMYAGYKVTR